MAVLESPSLASEVIGHIGGFEVRNTMLMAWLTMALVVVISLCLSATRYKMVPGRFQALMELIVEELFLFFNSVMLDTKQTKRVFPLVATIFLFIMIANWLGILPGVGSITIMSMHHGEEAAVPLLRSMNADVNMTLAIAIIAFFAVQIIGVAELGVFKYSGKFLIMPWKKPYVVGTLVGFLEFIGEFTRLISFTFRLFGNIFAGEVLLLVIGFLVPYVAPVPFLGLEIFVGFIQALVFSMLTIVFLKMAMTAHEDHDDHAPPTKKDLSKRVLNAA